MHTPSPESLGISAASVPLLFSIVGGVLALFLFLFADYFRRKRAEVATVTAAAASAPERSADDHKASKPAPSATKKSQPRSHFRHTDKDHSKKHHPLDVNTLKGDGVVVTALCFSSDGHNFATDACADGVVRVCRIDVASSKSFKLLRINLPAGAHPTGIAFSEEASSVVVAAQVLSGASRYMYGDVSAKPSGEGKQYAKLPVPEIKWEHQKIHGKSSVLTLVGVCATYGSGDGSTIIASCSEGTDIKLRHGKSGKDLGTVDTNQLKNNMGTISPNGHCLAAAAFSADVKVVCSHLVMFTPDSEQKITASKDGSIRIWNINVCYHLDEDLKTLKVFAIPLHDAKGSVPHYDRFSISPNGNILAVTNGSTLQWLCAETGKVLDTANQAHEGDIMGIAWASQLIPMVVDPRWF